MHRYSKSLSVEQALALLPQQPEIHTILHTPTSDFYDRWDRATTEQRIREATRREIAGRIACTSGHSLAIQYGESTYFVETKDGAHEARH